MEFVEGVDGTPHVGYFVFEEAAREWEDPVDRLSELEKWWEVPRFLVDGEGERGD